ncbi:MAG TPA: alpha-amylase family protein [Hydrogenophaga sp.]|uniref:alpha-amylase family protein n=1 Tax=Hydrogenophaga sp. TaxID=1904254 RepID=UPI002BA26B33|nr:alpha-amylase family protein [Hydrogenophaga sp.]HSX91967.1 alpha-amylase family protein [Hydrogenophaga sp.]
MKDWYRSAVIYQADVTHFQDSDGDGVGDLAGLVERLPYLRGLGVTCLWLTPFYASPFRDGGYDVADHMAIDPRLGTMADMVAVLEAAENLGIRVIVDLVAQHTSDQHPWFQAARRDRHSRYRDYYVWSDEPEATDVKPIFPTVENSVWAWDEAAGQYYRHVFYRHEPDLNLAHPAVREEIFRIMAFWLRMGVAGFRVDAASHMIERAKLADPRDDGYWLMNELRAFVQARNPEAVLFGEVDVPPRDYARYFGDGDRLSLVSNFWLNNHLYLALARGAAEPLQRALRRQPRAPAGAQYAVWVRNHDELDLERLSPSERQEVLDRFAPEPGMRIYDRGIRRRLPPMLDGDADRIALTHAIVMSLPGTPIVRYGDEIGMGDDLSLAERHAVRTIMQWSDESNAGFSTVAPEQLDLPLIDKGPFRYQRVNVYQQALDDRSLLARIGKMARARIGSPAMGSGHFRVLGTDCPSVLAIEHRGRLPQETLITLANLAPKAVRFALPGRALETLVDVLCDGPYARSDSQPGRLTLHANGYRWLRRRRDRA